MINVKKDAFVSNPENQCKTYKVSKNLIGLSVRQHSFLQKLLRHQNIFISNPENQCKTYKVSKNLIGLGVRQQSFLQKLLTNQNIFISNPENQCKTYKVSKNLIGLGVRQQSFLQKLSTNQNIFISNPENQCKTYKVSKNLIGLGVRQQSFLQKLSTNQNIFISNPENQCKTYKVSKNLIGLSVRQQSFLQKLLRHQNITKLMIIFFGKLTFLREVEKIHEFSLPHEPINSQFPNIIPKIISRLTSHVSPLTSHLSRLTSHVSPLTSHLSRLTSHVSLLLSLVLCLTSHVSAQIPPLGQFGEIDTLALQDTIPFSAPDTSAVKFFYANDFTPRRILDTLEKVHRYSPILRQKYGYYDLGDFGSPHHQTVYQPRSREGIDLGFHHYDLYLKKAHEQRFFNTSHPYSQFMYTAGPTQEEGFVNAVFAQNLSPNFSASIDYSRIIHKGAYDGQRVRHTNFGVSAWYRSTNDRYYGLLSWAGNTIKQQNNGGIQSDTFLINSNYDNRNLIPTRLAETAQTEYDHNELVYTQYFNVFRKKGQQLVSPQSAVGDSLLVTRDSLIRDSLVVIRDSLTLDSLPANSQPATRNPLTRNPQLGTGFLHRFRYKQERLKAFDTQPSPTFDPDFYGVFRTNERGLRHFVNVRKFENRFGAFLFLGKNDEFRFEPALTHAFVLLDQEPQDSTMQELRVSAELSTSIANIFDLKGYAHYELGANRGDYMLKGDATLKLGRLGTLEGQFWQHQYAPNLIEYRLFISQEAVWENDFNKTNETNFMVKYRLPTLKLGKKLEADISGGIENHLLSNFIYYDTLKMPVQAPELKNIAQVFAEANFRFGKIYAENKIVVQQTGDEYLRLPRLWLQHSLYFQGHVFKSAALLRAGADFRYQSNLKLDDWWALTGQFHRQGEQSFVSQPTTDVFLSFKVNRFRTFVMLGNAFQPLAFTTRLAAPNYPTRDMFFRFGLTWAFMD